MSASLNEIEQMAAFYRYCWNKEKYENDVYDFSRYMKLKRQVKQVEKASRGTKAFRRYTRLQRNLANLEWDLKCRRLPQDFVRMMEDDNLYNEVMAAAARK